MLRINMMRIPALPSEPSHFRYDKGWMAWVDKPSDSTGCFAITAEEAVGALILQQFHLGELEEYPDIRTLAEEGSLLATREASEETGASDLPQMVLRAIGRPLIAATNETDAKFRGLVKFTEHVVDYRFRKEEFRAAAGF